MGEPDVDISHRQLAARDVTAAIGSAVVRLLLGVYPGEGEDDFNATYPDVDAVYLVQSPIEDGDGSLRLTFENGQEFKLTVVEDEIERTGT